MCKKFQHSFIAGVVFSGVVMLNPGLTHGMISSNPHAAAEMQAQVYTPPMAGMYLENYVGSLTSKVDCAHEAYVRPFMEELERNVAHLTQVCAEDMASISEAAQLEGVRSHLETTQAWLRSHATTLVAQPLEPFDATLVDISADKVETNKALYAEMITLQAKFHAFQQRQALWIGVCEKFSEKVGATLTATTADSEKLQSLRALVTQEKNRLESLKEVFPASLAS